MSRSVRRIPDYISITSIQLPAAVLMKGQHFLPCDVVDMELVTVASVDVGGDVSVVVGGSGSVVIAMACIKGKH